MISSINHLQSIEVLVTAVVRAVEQRPKFWDVTESTKLPIPAVQEVTQMKGQIAPPMMEYPDKLFYRIREVSMIAGVKPYVLRYWESEFPDLAPEKGSSDQRRYRKKDIQTVLAIRKLLYEDKYTIKGARDKLREELGKWRERGDQRRVAAAQSTEPAAKPIIRAVRNSSGVIENEAGTMRDELAELRRETLALLNYLDE